VITSVTSATVTATSAASSWAVALGAGGAILVIGLLIALELLGPTETPRIRVVRQLLRTSVIPLLIVFAVSTGARVLAVLGA
jgi:hypothetical protein